MLSFVAALCLVFAFVLQPAGAQDAAALPFVICHAGGDPAPAPDKAPGQHTDCALCPLCLAASLHALGAVPPPVPMPRIVSSRALRPPARDGPAPGLWRDAARARGPPVSV